MLFIVFGSILKGCFRRLNRAIDENAFSASKTFSLFENTNIKNETADTFKRKKNLNTCLNYCK